MEDDDLVVDGVMSKLLSSRPKKLEVAIVGLSTQAPTLFLNGELRFLLKYATDAAAHSRPLDQLLIPLTEHSLRSAASEHTNQVLILVNWLFQHHALFTPLSNDLASIISTTKDCYIALGWCRLVSSLLTFPTTMTNFLTNGLRDNYKALVKILSSCIPRLCVIVDAGSVLQHEGQRPTRLAAAAADCILVLTEALTRKSLSSGATTEPLSISKEKQVDQNNFSSAVSHIDGQQLLWQNLDRLIILVQKLHSWSKGDWDLHAKGLDKVLKWLCKIKSKDAKDGKGQLSSFWNHYSKLCLLEDSEIYQRCDELVKMYLSRIEKSMECHLDNRESCVETSKFIMNCLALLLGRLTQEKLESTISVFGLQISHALISQLHCEDEDVADMAVSLFRSVILELAQSSFTDPIKCEAFLPPLLGLLDKHSVIPRAIAILIAEGCSIESDHRGLKEVLKRFASESVAQRRNAAVVISEFVSKTFVHENLPCVIHLHQVAVEVTIRVACVSVLHFAVNRLRTAIAPYAQDVLRVSFRSIQNEYEPERYRGAKLMESLMASKDEMMQSISGMLLEARSIVLNVITSEASPRLRQVCQKVLESLPSQQE